MDSATIYAKVNERYGASARAKDNHKYGAAVASAFGYSPDELASIPQEANLGLSCGNPLALAGLREGETVVDLGSGAGFDVFLAAKRVGEKGKAIGVDMNEDMLRKARQNAEKNKVSNVEFLESTITSMPLPDSSVDVVISNCVINLVPDSEKPQVFREIYRVLKPGGRVAVSDILAKTDLPEQMKNDLALYVGCVAGASKREEYEKWIADAGLTDAVIVDAESDLNVYTQTDDNGQLIGSICCGPVEGEDRPVHEEKTGGCCPPKEAVKESSCCKPKEAPKESGCCKPKQAEKENGCCKPKETASCCGGGAKEDGGVVADLKTNFKEVDLNDWAGSYKIFAVKPEN